MPFSEQAFVYPRCSCLCSDLILPIYLPPTNQVPVYYVPFQSGSWGSTNPPRPILSALGKTQSCLYLVIQLLYRRAREGKELKPALLRTASPKRFKNKHENCFEVHLEALTKSFSGDTMELCTHIQGLSLCSCKLCGLVS